MLADVLPPPLISVPVLLTVIVAVGFTTLFAVALVIALVTRKNRPK